MARPFVRLLDLIVYQHRKSWVQAEIHMGAVYFEKNGEVPLRPKQCRELSSWLLAAADEIERRKLPEEPDMDQQD